MLAACLLAAVLYGGFLLGAIRSNIVYGAYASGSTVYAATDQGVI